MREDMDPDEFIFESVRRGNPMETAYGQAREIFGFDRLCDYFFDMPWFLMRHPDLLKIMGDDGFALERAARTLTETVGNYWSYITLRKAYDPKDVQDCLVDFDYPMRHTKLLEKRLTLDYR